MVNGSKTLERIGVSNFSRICHDQQLCFTFAFCPSYPNLRRRSGDFFGLKSIGRQGEVVFLKKYRDSETCVLVDEAPLGVTTMP